MIYKLEFVPSALKEWNRLGDSIKEEFKKVLKNRLDNPRIQKHKLSGWPNIYKIKLRSVGYRLVYEVDDGKVTVLVLAVGKREKNSVYDKLKARTKNK